MPPAPKRPVTSLVALRLRDSLLTVVDQLAEEEETTRSAMIRKLIEEGLEARGIEHRAKKKINTGRPVQQVGIRARPQPTKKIIKKKE